jgi:NAD(P)-dependent dehydrogenase (short-subunit alcohol dehydrogenase family)
MSITTPTLDGQTILIIGGTSGIGLGVALASLNAGASTVIVASSTSEKVEHAVKRLKDGATRKEAIIKGLVIDAKDLDAIDKSMKEIGVINHLVYTAGQAIRLEGFNIKDTDVATMKGESQTLAFYISVAHDSCKILVYLMFVCGLSYRPSSQPLSLLGVRQS